MQRLRRIRLSTFQTISIGFVGLILLGTLLLMLPISSRAPGSVPFADCLFTATSAVCVTGLVVRDTAVCWSPFGQAVLLALIQVGGLGVVTAAAALAFLSGRRIGLKSRSTMQEAIAAPQVGGIVRLTHMILRVVACIEGAGALLLWPVFWRRFGVGRGLWMALFHSVSAFCNAGFDLMGTTGAFSSLTSLAEDPLANIVLMLLITVGGIGFLTWNDVREYRWRLKKYRLQSKVILLTSAVLVVLPALWFFFFEMPERAPGARVLPALFQSVTLRTAGFNTVDLAATSGSGQALMLFWMLVGGSPGSTAGGMKTTTIAVLILAAHSVFRRRGQLECLGRRIPEETVVQAAAILFMYLGLFFAGAVVICRLEGIALQACLFETASAVGTVGLTLGITPSLGLVSRGILIVLMFLGRVGGLTLIYAAQPAPRPGRGALPLEKITVG